MLLRIDDEATKPTCLTLDLFASLMPSESRRKAIFQIVSFTRKRERTYSTRISDGFFNVKVMMIHEAADQIDRGQIKEMYILEGWIRNHGEGAVIIRERVTEWEHSRLVGNSVKWRPNKTNINYRGSNIIAPVTQTMESLHKSAMSIPDSQEVPAKQVERKSNRKSKGRSKKKKSKSSRKSKSTKKNKSPPQTPIKSRKKQGQKQQYSFLFDSTQHKDTSKPQASLNPQPQIQQVIKKSSSSMTVSLGKVDDHSPPAQKNTSKGISQQKAKQLWEILLFDEISDEQQQTKEVGKVNAEIKVIPQPLQQKRKLTDNYTKSGKKIDLQFIVDMLADSDDSLNASPQNTNRQNLPKISSDKKQCDSDSDSDSELMDFIKSKKLLAPVPEKKEEVSSSSMSRQGGHVPFWDLYHGLFSGHKPDWHFTFVLKCIVVQKGGYALAVLTDSDHQLLINANVRRLEELNIQLRQGLTYCCKGAVIRPNSLLNMTDSSNCQLQMDGVLCKFEQVPVEDKEIFENSKLYAGIEQIPTIADNTYLNVMGLILSYKLRKTKTGKNMANYEIVDPISKSSITVVEFDPACTYEQECDVLLDKPVTFYNIQVGCFNSKKNLVCKGQTLFRFNWLPLTQRANQIYQWFELHCSAKEVQIEPSGHSQVSSLGEALFHSSNNVKIKGVTILQFKPKFTYRACCDCFKKVEDRRCRSCGVRSEQQIIDRVFLRGQIGDDSDIVGVIWSTTLAESLLSQGFPAMRRKWVLKVVEVWLQRVGGNYTVVQMKVDPDVGAMCRGVLASIREGMLV